MSTAVVTIGPGEAASKAWSRMQQKRIRHLVVTDNGRLVGVISDRDLGGGSGAAVRKDRAVRDLMTPEVASASPGASLRQAANLMRGRLVGSLPIVERGRIVGIVTATDVLDALGRGSARPTAQTKRREPKMPQARSRKNVKRRVDVPDAGAIPIHIRGVGLALNSGDRDYLRRKLDTKLGKFGEAIERASVRIEDVNGPRGGIDKVCRIKVVLSGLPSVLVEERHASLQGAMDRTLDRTERAVRRDIQRRRMRVS